MVTMQLLRVLAWISWCVKLTEQKVIEIQAGDERPRTDCWNYRYQYWCVVSNVLPTPGLATKQKRLDSTGILNFDKLPENFEFLVAEISVLNRRDSTTNPFEARLQRPMPWFLTSCRTFHRSFANNTHEEDGIELLQNIRTTEIKKMTATRVLFVVTGKRNIPLMRSSMQPT